MPLPMDEGPRRTATGTGERIHVGIPILQVAQTYVPVLARLSWAAEQNATSRLLAKQYRSSFACLITSVLRFQFIARQMLEAAKVLKELMERIDKAADLKAALLEEHNQYAEVVNAQVKLVNEYNKKMEKFRGRYSVQMNALHRACGVAIEALTKRDMEQLSLKEAKEKLAAVTAQHSDPSSDCEDYRKAILNASLEVDNRAAALKIAESWATEAMAACKLAHKDAEPWIHELDKLRAEKPIKYDTGPESPFAVRARLRQIRMNKIEAEMGAMRRDRFWWIDHTLKMFTKLGGERGRMVTLLGETLEQVGPAADEYSWSLGLANNN